MIDERLEALLWAELDGCLSPEEERSLEELVARDPEARTERERLAGLSRTLARLPEVAPPIELRSRIRREVASRTATARPRGDSFLDAVRAAFGSVRVTQARFAFLMAGLLAGLVVSLLLSGGFEAGSAVDRSLLYGSVNSVRGDWLEMEIPEVRGHLRLRREEGRVVTLLTAAGAFDVAVEELPDGGAVVVVSSARGTLLERRFERQEIPGS